MREGRRVYVLYCTESETHGQTDKLEEGKAQASIAVLGGAYFSMR
jgi:hypothetical protein